MIYLSSEAVGGIAAAVLTVILVPPSFVLFVLSIIYGRQNIEWARPTYNYFRPALALFTLYCLLHAATHVASAVWRMLPGYIPALGTAYGNLHPIAHFFDSVTEMLVFLSLSHLAEGIIKAQSGAFRFHLLLKVSRCLVVFTLGCLVAAALVLYIVVENSGLYRAIDDNCSYYSWCYWYEYDFPTILYTALKIDVAFTAIVWIMSLGLTAWSVLIAYRCNGEKRVARTAKYLVFCGILWFVRTTYILAMVVRDNYHGYWKHGHANASGSVGFVICNVPATIWTMFGVLVILYMLGNNSHNGLWVRDGNDVSSKVFQLNQTFKSFQNIDIPVLADHDRTELSSRGQEPSPVSTQAHLPTSPPPPFPAAIYSEPRGRPGQVQDTDIELAIRPHNPDWARPPSCAPPTLHSRAGSPPMSPSRAASPPSHEELMGFNHQADGYTPSAPLPYGEKS